MDVKVQPSETRSEHDQAFALSLTDKGSRRPGVIPGLSPSLGSSLGSSLGPSPSPKKIVIVAIIVLTMLAACGLAYKYWADANEKNKASAGASRAVLTVELTKVKRLNFDRKLLVSGTVSAWDPVQVGSEVSGLKVESIAVDEGAHVKKGQVMATLNSSILRAQLAQQEARLASSRAGLTKAIQPNRPEDLTSLKAAYEQAQVNVAQEEANLMRCQATSQEAEANAKRYEFLVKQGVVSGMEGLGRTTTAKTTAADVHSAEAKVKAAKLSAQQAHDRLSMGLIGGRNEDVVISRASLSEIEATVSQLRSQVAQTIIRAPCDGLVVKRSAHIGEIASTTKVMFDLVRDGRLELRAQVSESDLSRIKPGQKVELQAVQPSAPVIYGTVREISPTIDLDSRLGTVRIDLPAGEKEPFRSGNFARGELFLGQESVLSVPASCIVYKDNRAIVFTVSGDGNAQMRFVDAGERDFDNIEIKSGLREGEAIVAKGAGFLKDGDKVKVAPQQ